MRIRIIAAGLRPIIDKALDVTLACAIGASLAWLLVEQLSK